MRRQPLHCDRCDVRDQAACAALAPGERLSLSRIGHHRSLGAGETLFAAGSDNGLCATLISGALKVAAIDSDGREQILDLIHPAGFAGELFAPLTSQDVIALTDCELCVFRRSEYEQAIERFPALAKALLQRTSRDLTQSRTLRSATSGRSSGQRVAAFLLSMARAASDSECHPADSFDLILSRGEIAAMLGLTIETVSRQLTRLERASIITRQGARGITVLNNGRLGSEAGEAEA